MRALVIIDTIFAARERAMLSRLEMGLADEGIRVVHAVPAGAAAKEEAASGAGQPVFASAVTYSDAAIPFSLGIRAHRLREAVRRAEDLDDDEPVADVIHAWGGGTWAMAMELGRLERAPMILEVWRAGLVARAATLSETKDKSRRLMLLSPDQAIDRALAAAGGGGVGIPVRSAPWGVFTPTEIRLPFSSDRPLSAMVIGSGQDQGSFTAAIVGLAEVVKERPDTLIFVDAEAAQRTKLWKAANELGIVPNLTLIDQLEARRDLVLDGDLLVVPEARGEQRSILLEAMAGGMIVVAAADPMVSSLQNGFTARLIGSSTGKAWGQSLLAILRDVRACRELAASARSFVATQRQASSQVRAVIEAYSAIARRQTIPIGR